ncbi:nucleotide exchange factor GrpE [Herbaspirillum sp. YR522]|uniref:nucleotide exchange factor GrpE n=1 Tax=Herbaspirillum sp. YR522 TaxID=1144342 RepID=UPI00026F88A5|nr:nucleotide exchange factor GrpE [Herbaspirillum sp. YR522]EJM98184.1 molecular chaperone GrpE (heat shock protein) [Herbaspirillum sp. YR522]
MQDNDKQQAQNEQASVQAEQVNSGEGEAQVEPVAAAEPTLEDKLAAAEARAAEMQDAFLRARAEGENIRRRAQDDIAKAHKFAIEGFAESLLAVKDSLEMALKLDNPSLESLKEGVEMTLKQLSSAFEKNKLQEVNPQAGEKLDPMKHQAISAVPAEQDANTVVTVLQKGYVISERLLRPALVTVAQGK